MASAGATLEAWMEYRTLTLAQLDLRYGLDARSVTEDVRYLGLDGLTRVYDRTIHPGQFFFRDGVFVLLYVEDPDSIAPELTQAALRDYLGEPAAQLRSRAGKQHQQYVYPERGVAFSATPDTVSFLEIFQPMSLETYQRELYVDPGPFRR